MSDFVALSAALTGFGRLELLGTGLVEVYRTFLGQTCGYAFEELLASQDLDTPLAARVAELWYTGTWRPLDGGPMRVVAANGHAEALVWRVMGVSAPGTRPNGFGSWA